MADECQVSVDFVAKLWVIGCQLLLVLNVRHKHWPHVPVLQDREQLFYSNRLDQPKDLCPFVDIGEHGAKWQESYQVD